MAQPEDVDRVSPQSVGDALARILASDAFGKSPRLRRFVAYIVEKALSGNADEVKEYSVALAVFDRDPSFDPANDTIVRVEARRLRNQLAAYYNGPGRDDPVAIELPRGGYVPVFRNRNPESSHQPSIPFLRRPVSYGSAAAILAILLAGVTLWLLSARLRVPHSWALEGSTLRVFDAAERLCWEKRFPALDDNFRVLTVDKVLIADIDRDNQVEVLFNLVPANVGAVGGSLVCLDRSGKQRWAYRYGGASSRTFGDRTFDPAYRGRLIRPFLLGGRPMLLTVANHYLWYPSQVALLDASTGRMIEEYWHPGSIYHCDLHDVDGDGVPEAVFAAVNNPGQGLGHAGIGILSLPFSRPPRPMPAPGNPFPPPTGGGELAYVLLPLPDVNRVLGWLPAPVNFKVTGDRITVELQVPDVAGIVYDLDFRLNVVDFRTSDNFASLHERLHAQHLLNHALTRAETESLGKVAHFPAAPDGNSAALSRFWAF